MNDYESFNIVNQQFLNLRIDPQREIESPPPQKKIESKAQGQIKIKRQGTMAIVKVILKSGESIKPILRALGNMIASGITYPFSRSTSQAFKAKMAHAGFALVNIWAKSYFGEDLAIKCMGTRNVARKEILASKEDYKASLKLLELCKEIKSPNVVVTSDNPESQISDGICAGIRLDIAQRHLVTGESIENIIKSNEKGAPSEAAANQAIYKLLEAKNPTIKEIFEFALSHLQKASESEGDNRLGKVNFSAVAKMMKVLDNDILNEEMVEKFIDYKDGDKSLSNLISEFIADERFNAKKLQNNDKHEFLTKNSSNEWEISNFPKFQKAVEKKIEEKFEKDLISITNKPEKLKQKRDIDLNILKWTVSFLELKQEYKRLTAQPSPPITESPLNRAWRSLREKALKIFGKKTKKDPFGAFGAISNPLIRHALHGIYNEERDKMAYGTVAQARFLNQVSVANIMGDSSLHKSDESFLKNLSQLPPGFYAIDLKTSESGHSISYVKEEGGKGYILDPNGFPLACNTPEHAIELLLKLLILYPEPKIKAPISGDNESHHQLVISKLESKIGK